MVNLYELLSLPPDASAMQIRAALNALEQTGRIDGKEARAVREWLLVPEVRTRYDARLRSEQPDFFAPPQPVSSEALPADGQKRYRIRPKGAAPRQTSAAGPALWNPKAVAIWALLLSPLFAWLHAENWEALGEPEKARRNRWFVFAVVGVALGGTLLSLLGGIRIPLYASLLLWLGWFVTMGREQIEWVRNRFGDDYERRPWGKAIGLVALAVVGLLFAALVLALLAQIAGVLHPSLSVE